MEGRRTRREVRRRREVGEKEKRRRRGGSLCNVMMRQQVSRLGYLFIWSGLWSRNLLHYDTVCITTIYITSIFINSDNSKIFISITFLINILLFLNIFFFSSIHSTIFRFYFVIGTTFFQPFQDYAPIKISHTYITF